MNILQKNGKTYNVDERRSSLYSYHEIMFRKYANKNASASSITEDNLILEEHHVLAEVFMALEKSGFNAYAADRSKISVREAASFLHLRADLLEALCEFLAEKELLLKVEPGVFEKTDRFSYRQGPIPFLLAYKEVWESLSELMDGSQVYGRNIIRDARYLGTGTKLIFPMLAELFKARGFKRILDLGCGNGAFLLMLASSLPDFTGIGVEIDPPTVKDAEKLILASGYEKSIRVICADVRRPETFSKKVDSVEALIGIGIFHEFRKDSSLIPLLNRYKKHFPKSRLFLVEFETPDWDELRQRPHSPERQSSAIYRLIHYFSEQGLPQSKDNWIETIGNSDWRLFGVHQGPNRLIAFECK